MPVPDNTYFGEKPEGGAIRYGEVRLITDEQRKLEILKKRLDVLLIGQITELTYFSDGTRKIYSPFPLTVLTLLSIETVGHIINDEEKVRKENEFEQSKILVTPVYQLMGRTLSYKPSKQFYKAFEKLHNKKVKKAVSKYSDVIHTTSVTHLIMAISREVCSLRKKYNPPLKLTSRPDACILILIVLGSF